MKIRIEPHTLKRAEERGTTKEEIYDVINTGIDIAAKGNRLGKYKVYKYNKDRNKVFYKQKRVEVYFIVENNNIITVTVYVFYGKWEE